MTEFESDPVSTYFKTIWSILSSPRKFFQNMPHSGGLTHPLAFALITNWVGAAFAFIWSTLIFGTGNGQLEQVLKTFGGFMGSHQSPPQISAWIWGAAMVLANPLITVVTILITSLFVFIAARLFVTPGQNGAPQEITFESAARILAYGMTPSILGVLPFIGGFFAGLYGLVVTTIGAMEVYKISAARAILVILFPRILIFVSVMALFFFMILALLLFALPLITFV